MIHIHCIWPQIMNEPKTRNNSFRKTTKNKNQSGASDNRKMSNIWENETEHHSQHIITTKRHPIRKQVNSH